jgi:hypothetical protein
LELAIQLGAIGSLRSMILLRLSTLAKETKFGTNKALVIGSVFFNHRLREANSVAHSLAKKCFLIKYSSFWVDEPPRFLLDNLLNDFICVDHQ